ncbi:MAG: isoaspartyl peptidase/L-asparaginase [Ignavibacteria bacterium]|nr:isoaspartyl peptidase/L-asparaginase [Ignavibacteria bacterium]
MKKIIVVGIIFLLPFWVFSNKPFAIIVHGGAGTYSNDSIQNYKIMQVISDAVEKGYKVLENGGAAVDAVETAIKVLEDSRLFNAGKGSVLNEEGFVEMDASIMEGKELKAGAVAGVRDFPNPISLARLVMEKTPHLLFAGEGVGKLIDRFQLKRINPDSLVTPEKLQEIKSGKIHKKGTVGAVALDKYGNIAAGTSTGGIANKMVGRVGDSPIIGAGTYAKNSTCGVSCTGLGEFFIKQSAAFHISALIEYANYSLKDAVGYVLSEIMKMGATGGIIAIDKNGNIFFDYTTQGMPCGYKSSSGVKKVLIFK